MKFLGQITNVDTLNATATIGATSGTTSAIYSSYTSTPTGITTEQSIAISGVVTSTSSYAYTGATLPLIGVYGSAIYTATSGGIAAGFAGVYGLATISAGAPAVAGTISGVIGAATNASSTAATWVSAITSSYVTNTGAGSIASASGVLVNAISVASTTANYGIYVNNITGSAGTNYAIYTGTGIVKHADNTASTTTTTGALVVAGGVGIGGRLSLAASMGVEILSGAPGTTANTLYNVGGSLYFNGSAVGFTRIPVADANYTIATTASVILAYTSITAARVLTLPAATQAGQIVWVVDSSGASSTTKTITVTRAGTDTIEGIGTTWTINSPYTSVCLESNGSGKWAVLAYEEVPILMADTNTTVTNREDVLILITSITAARTITLPAAIVTGQRVTVLDVSGSVSTTNTVTINRAGSDTINGLTSYVVSVAYGYVELVASGTTSWNATQSLQIASGASLTTTGAFPLTLTTTASTTATFPTGAITVAQLGAQTFTGLQTFTGGMAVNTANDITLINNIPIWLKYTFTYSALSTAALTNSITLVTLPAAGIIHAIKLKHSIAFTGGALSSYTLSVGISGNLDKYANSFNVFQATGNTTFYIAYGMFSENHGATTSVLLTATSIGANLNAATAGSCDIWVLVSKAV